MKGKSIRFNRALSVVISAAMMVTSLSIPNAVYADEIVDEIVEEVLTEEEIPTEEIEGTSSESDVLLQEEEPETEIEDIEETEEAADKAATKSGLLCVVDYDAEDLAEKMSPQAATVAASVDETENACKLLLTDSDWGSKTETDLSLGTLKSGKYKITTKLKSSNAYFGNFGLYLDGAWKDNIVNDDSLPTTSQEVTLDNIEIASDSSAVIKYWLKGDGNIYIYDFKVYRYVPSFSDFSTYVTSDTDVQTALANGEEAYVSGWTEFNSAYNAANSYISSHDAESAVVSEVNELYEALLEALGNLTLGMSISDLETILADGSDADIINKLDSGCLVEGYAEFKTAYNAAKALVDNGSTNSAAITAAYNNLLTAIDALVRIKTLNMYVYSDRLVDISDYVISADGDNKDIVYNDGNKLSKAFEDESDFWYHYDLKLKADAVTGAISSSTFGYAVNDAAWETPFPALGQYNANTSALFTAVKAANDGDSFYLYANTRAYNGTYTYATTATDSSLLTKIKTNANSYLTSLQTTISANALVSTDYSAASWARLQSAIATANTITVADEVSDIIAAFVELRSAYNGLMSANTNDDINVQKVPGLPDGFAYGGDISSFYSLMQAGTVFKDEKGKALTDQEFFDYLYEGGMNYARIRIFNDPYDSSGNGYGGGNNDLQKAIAMGKLATNSGMKVLIDFHYSDFWADPSKYMSPKAWVGLTPEEKAEELYKFTYDSLKELIDAGVDVEMVQIGNESNHGIAGVTDADATILYGYGCEAVNAINTEYSKTIKKAVHFTDVQQGGGVVTGALSKQLGGTYAYRNEAKTAKVDYDAVGVSYYPMYRHGSIDNLESVLKNIKATYEKDVFVAETSWATTWGDGDGFSNSGPSLEGQDTETYSISVQGQVDELRAVVNAVNKASGIGVFYWEPAWIAPYVATYDDFTWNEENYAKNKEAWEKYGIGWASSYSYEYDPTDAGLYYGGIGVDNMAWFGFDGKALPSAKAYKLIKEGVSKVNSGELVSVQKNRKMEVALGEEVPYPETVTGYLDTYGITGETVSLNVIWNADDKEKVNIEKAGYYTVNGVATHTDGSKYSVILTIEIVATNNVILANGNFENYYKKKASDYRFKSWDIRAWVQGNEYITDNFHGSGNKLFSIENNNQRSGNGALNFWRSDKALNITVTQQLDSLDAGKYTFGGYFEGGSAGEYDTQYAVAYVYDKKADYEAELSNGLAIGDKAVGKYKNGNKFGGWLNWKNVEIKDIQVDEGQFVVVGFEFNGTPAGAWGSVDDAYMYGNYGVNVAEIKNGTVEVSDYTPNTNAKVTISAKADKGYALKNIEVTGTSVNNTYFTEGNGWVVSGNTAKYTPADAEKTAKVIKAVFKMPESDVTVKANFENPVAESADIAQATILSLGGVANPGNDKFSFVADDKAFTPAVVLNYKGYVLTKSDFTAKYADNDKPGTATITVTGKGKFTGTKEIKFTLKDGANKNISKDFTVVLKNTDSDKGYFYTGSDVEVVTGLKDANGAVVNPANYKVSYDKNIKVGTATAIITGIGEYSGSIKQQFKIVKADISVLKDNGALKLNGKTKADIDKAVANGTYIDGSKGVTPGITLYDGANMLKQKRDYTVSYKNNKEITVGKDKKATVTIKGAGNYTGTLEISFDVEPKSINDEATIRVVVDDMVESTSPKAPKVTVYAKSNSKTEKKLKADNFYISSISKNGVAFGSYKDAAEAKANAKVKDAGIYQVTITGINNFKDSQVVDLRVVDKDHMLSKSNVKFGKVYYTGKAITISSNSRLQPDESEGKTVSVNKMKVTAGDKVLKLGRDFEITEYKNNQKAGTATIRIKGMGEYAGKFTTDFKIEKLKMVEPARYAELVAADKAVGYATTDLSQMTQRQDSTYGYMHYYTGYKLTPEYDMTVSANGIDTIKVNQNKDYKLSYTNNVKPNDFDGDGNCDDDKKPIVATIGGMNNYSGTLKVTMDGKSNDDFAITARTIKDFTVQFSTVNYEGSNIKPVPTFIDKAKGVAVYMNPSTYSVKYYNNKKVAGGSDENASPFAVVTAKGDFAAGLSKEDAATEKLYFNIAATTITLSDVEKIKPQSYKNGLAVEPKVKVSVNGKSLSEGKDYVVTYSNNCLKYAASDKVVDANAPTVTIIGIGNYTGEVSRTFTIM